MKKLFPTNLILSWLLLNFAVSTAAQASHKIEFLVKSATHNKVFLKCGNDTCPGTWSGIGTRQFFIESNKDQEDLRKLQYQCSIALPNLGEKVAVVFGPLEFDFSKNHSNVVFIVESIDAWSKCAKGTPFYQPAEATYSLSIDGNLIKKYESVCF